MHRTRDERPMKAKSEVPSKDAPRVPAATPQADSEFHAYNWRSRNNLKRGRGDR